MLHKKDLPETLRDKLEELCTQTAKERVFCNVDEDNFPKDLDDFFARDILYDETTEEEAVVWEPYEYKSCREIESIYEGEKFNAWDLVLKALETANYNANKENKGE